MLLKKLKHYGVRGHALKLITSYVSSRSQYVVLNHCPSENLKIRNGVPQGSLLGPLLFNVYINDFRNISKAVKYIIYADDTSIFLSSRNIVELTSEANRVLTSLTQWSFLNSLKINRGKTKAIIFHPKGKNVLNPPRFFLENTAIEYVDNFTSLGVVFTATMSWNAHVSKICVARSRFNGIMWHNKGLLPAKTKLDL